jgi:hypothetical protein
LVASGFGAVDRVAKAGDTMTGELVAPDVNLSGLTGATAASRIVGATTSGSPASGTFSTGDVITTHAGQVFICTAGGTSGTWVSAGSGMSNPMTTLGDTIFENSTPTAARLAGNITATKNFLTQTGTGSVSAAPAWGTIQAADVPTLNQNTSGTAGNVTGTVAIANGGTGQVTAYPAAVGLGAAVALSRGSVTLGNSAVKTNIAAATIPSNDPITDAVYRIRCWGLLSTTSNPSVTFTVAWGGTTLLSTGAIGMGTTVTNQQFFFEVEEHFTSATSCATLLNAQISIVTAAMVTPAVFIDQAVTTTVTVSPAQTFALTAQWSAANVANTLTSRYWVQRV